MFTHRVTMPLKGGALYSTTLKISELKESKTCFFHNSSKTGSSNGIKIRY